MVSANSRLSCSVISSRTGSISCNGISLVTVPKGWSSRAVWWKRGWADALCGLLELGFFGMKFSLSCEFGGKPEDNKIAKTEASTFGPGWVLVAGSTSFGCESPEMDAEPLGCRSSLNMRAAGSVGSAAPDAVHLSEEVDSRRTFDTRIRHSGFEFLGSYECARLFQTLPLKEKSEVVDVSSAAENTEIALAVFAPPVVGGIEHRFPGRIVGNFVVDEDVDHDFGALLSNVKRCPKCRKNARARITEEWDEFLAQFWR